MYASKKKPMQCALLVAALVQVLPACAAKPEQDAEEAKACEDCPDPGGRAGWVEAGIGMQSDDSTHFGRYSGQVDSGAIVNLNAAVSYRGRLGDTYINGELVDLGLDSRRISVDGGRQGKYAVGVEYEQSPNIRENLSSALLQTERSRTGIKFSLVPGKNWELTGQYRHERKDGTRDVGAGFGFNFPQILAVPVNFQTDDFAVALGYQGQRLQMRLAYEGSLFDNGQDAIDWNNPGSGPAMGSIAESPDNQFHQLSARLGYQLSDRTRLGASFARGRMTQDQRFLPYGTASATPLPTNDLQGEVNTTLAKVELNSRPMARLRLDASYTYSDRDNDTPVNAYAYLLTDSGVSPATRLNRPYGFTQALWRLKAGYRIANGTDVSAGFDHDRMERTYQQAEETEDQTFWAKLKFQPLDDLEAALKVSHADRDASTYDPTAYQSPETPLMKAFEMADRARDKVGFDLGWNVRDNLSFGFNFDYYQDDYKNMVLGLTRAEGFSATPSLTYTFNEALSASAYFTHEKLESGQSGSEWIPALSWQEEDANQTDTFGLSINWKAIAKKLDLGAEVVYSEFSGKMNYPGYSDLPEVSSRLTTLGVHGTYALKKDMSFRADYRYENYRENDWAKAATPTVTTLGVGPSNQETHLIFLSVRYTFK